MALLDDMLTEDQLATELGKCRRLLQLWRQRCEGPPWSRIGNSIYYRRASVDAWLRSLEQQPVRNRRRAASA
jgi:hypothetical protein